MIIFDIETKPLPLEQLEPLIPEFEPPPHPGNFDESTVKVGGLKDPDKIKAKRDSALAKHVEAVASYENDVKQKVAAHRAQFLEKAALSAATGQVLCIGYCSGDKVVIDDGSKAAANMQSAEANMLWRFWDKASKCRREKRKMVGLNIFEFDLPVMMRRSWMIGVTNVPDWLMWNDRYFSDPFVDLRVKWLAGQRWGDVKSDFNTLAAAFGTSGKPEGVDGGDFARLWDEDRPAAINYLTQDITQPAVWADKMGVI